MAKTTPEPTTPSGNPRSTPGPNARLAAFYLSRDRVLALIGAKKLPPHVLGALQGKDVAMAAAILSGVVGSYLVEAIAASGVKTWQQLFYENELRAGVPFIYNGHFHGKGFSIETKMTSLR